MATGGARQLSTRPGVLVLVVGPSGAGKDTLIAAAREALAGDSRFAFPRRIVTRETVAELEDHSSTDAAGFERAERGGAFALSWQAHGLSYGLPAAIADDLAAGRAVVANVSRAVIGQAMAKFQTRVLLVTASPPVRAARLAARGRESAAEIAARLAREGTPVPAGVVPVVIDNSGDLALGVAAAVAALLEICG